jgi:hypothetical protein
MPDAIGSFGTGEEAAHRARGAKKIVETIKKLPTPRTSQRVILRGRCRAHAR